MTTGRALVLLILLGALVINSIYLGYLKAGRQRPNG